MKLLIKNNQAGFTLIEYIVVLVIAAIMAALVSTYFGTALTQSGVPILRFQKASDLHTVMENIVADYNRLNALNLRWKWRSSTAYPINSIVVPTTNNGRYYKCTTAGTSGTTEPTWQKTNNPLPLSGATTTETTGTGVVWKESGHVWKATETYPYSPIVVVPLLNNGHYYRCTSGFTSGSTDPATTTGWPTTAALGTVTDGNVTWTEAGTILDTDAAPTNNLIYYLTDQPDRYGTGYTAETNFIKFSSDGVEEDAAAADEQNTLKVTIKSTDTSTAGETLTQLFTIR